MLDRKLKPNLWDRILQSDKFQNFSIANFKSEGANNRITQYSTKSHGEFFFKNIIYQMASGFSEMQFEKLRKIPNRHLGGVLY